MGRPRKRPYRGGRAVLGLHHEARGVRVDPFVQPRLLELVVPDHAVPELVAELVDGHHLHAAHGIQRPEVAGPDAAAGDERGVFHPARARPIGWGVHHRDRLVGIPAVPQAESLEPGFHRLHVALDLRFVLGLQEHGDRHVGEPHLVCRPAEQRRGALVFRGRHVAGCREAALHLDVARVRGPREVVNVRLLVRVGRRPVPVVPPVHAVARRAHHEPRGNGDVHAELAVVRVELRVGVVLVAVPAAGRAPAHARRLVDAQLREPLADEEEVALVAAAGEHLRQLGPEVDLERHRAAWRHGLGQDKPCNGAVVGVVVVGLLEGESAGEVRAARDAQGGDVYPAPLVGRPVAAQLPAGFLEERAAVVAEGVQVEMEPEVAHRVGGRVPPRDGLAALELLAFGVEPHVDRVADDSIGAVRQPIRSGHASKEHREKQGEDGQARKSSQAHGANAIRKAQGSGSRLRAQSESVRQRAHAAKFGQRAVLEPLAGEDQGDAPRQVDDPGAEETLGARPILDHEAARVHGAEDRERGRIAAREVQLSRRCSSRLSHPTRRSWSLADACGCQRRSGRSRCRTGSS